MIKLILSDLDGTIIDTHNNCDPSVHDVLQDMRKDGIRFAICSGRPVDSYMHMLAHWHLEDVTDYLIGANGGEVLELSTGRREESCTLSEDTVREVIDIYEPMGLTPTLYAGRDLYVAEMTEQVKTVAARIGINPIKADILQVLDRPQVKEMFVLDPAKMEEVSAYAAAHPDPRWVCFKTAPDLFEIAHPALGKHVGMKVIEEMSGIRPEEIIAFGDTTNDIPMLERAGWGVCMANGSPDALAAADDTAPACAENGFAQYLRAHVSGGIFRK